MLFIKHNYFVYIYAFKSSLFSRLFKKKKGRFFNIYRKMLIATNLKYSLQMILSNLCLINLEIQDNVLIITQLLTTIFLAILFIQSGIDKVTDKEGNLSWLSSHFSNSPLKNSVPFLLFTITVLELLAGFGNLIGAFYILFLDNAIVAFFGTLFSSISLIMLFFGQRVAKDYAGAQSLVSYFILTIVTLVLLCW